MKVIVRNMEPLVKINKRDEQHVGNPTHFHAQSFLGREERDHRREVDESVLSLEL